MMTNEEIEILYDNNFKKLYRFFYYKLLSKELAQDLTSETFTTLIAGQKSNSVIIKNYEKYLFGIAKIIFCEHLKKKYQEPNFIDYEDAPDFEETVTSTLEDFTEERTPEDILLSRLELLPKKQRAVISMRLIEKLSLKEIAQKLGKDMNYVKTTQKRAIKNLKEIFANNRCTLH
jgi:RNA polymerase sigma-70 factor (ECF subfamily)